MRVALIADIHGNATALRSVLDDIQARRVDVVVCLGDLAANGPLPGQAVEQIADLECPVVAGNTDIDMLHVPKWWRDPGSVGAPQATRRIVTISAWCADQLSFDHRQFLAALPITIEVELGSAGRLLGFHGSPRSSTDAVTDTTSDDELMAMMHGFPHTVLAGGHTHVPLLRRFGGQMIVNPGSAGLPFGEYGFAGETPVLDHASFGVVDATEDDVTFEVHDVPIDRDQLAEDVRRSEMPYGEWWLGLRNGSSRTHQSQRLRRRTTSMQQCAS